MDKYQMMNLISRKQEPVVDMSPVQLDPNGPEAKAIANFARTQQELLENRELIKRLTDDNQLHLRHIEQLEDQIKRVEARKEMYQRHSVSLFTRLNDVSATADALKKSLLASFESLETMIDAALRDAQTEASTAMPRSEQSNQNEKAATTAVEEALTDNGWGNQQ